jgi:predicted RNase H-like HicB family nuclease
MEKIIKRLTSYFKKDWDIEDYPIELFFNENAAEEEVKFGALIKNWSGMVAHGETKEKAFENLKENFKLFKDNNELPRPGTKVPLQFALTGIIDDYEDIAVDFFEKVIGLSYYDCFVSDQSSLTDFETMNGVDKVDKFKQDTISKTKEFFGVDISNTYDKYLVDVFEQIKKRE